MLQRTMPEQSLQQQSGRYTPQPSASPVESSGTPSGGLLGRLLALQAAQQQPRPFGRDRGQMPSTPVDPNFRQLARISPAVQQGGIGVSNRPDDQSSSSYSPFGDGIPPDVVRISGQGPGESGAHTETPAPVIAGFPRIGRAIPMPPMGPGTLPPIPMPQIAEWWQKAQELLKLYARMRYGGVGSGRENDDDYCYAERVRSGADATHVRRIILSNTWLCAFVPSFS